jgi:DNA polymerase-1
MRSSYNPAGTETGRWSASKFLITEGVNLQTTPQAWKDCFVADDGKVFWYADYSQIEARLVSYLAGDRRSIEIFERGGDIHRENAAVIFRKTPDQVSKRERDIGKSVHALNYGVGAETLMEFINKRGLETGVWVTRDLAKYIKDTYLSNFDQVVRWQEYTWATVQKTRSLTNPFGRRRIFLGPTSGPGSEHTKKEALAFVPQSTVPDLINEALVELRERPPVPGCEVLLNVHDALFGQGPEEGMDEWLSAIVKSMTRPITLQSAGSSQTITVTIPVEVQYGYRWGTLSKWTEKSTS